MSFAGKRAIAYGQYEHPRHAVISQGRGDECRQNWWKRASVYIGSEWKKDKHFVKGQR